MGLGGVSSCKMDESGNSNEFDSDNKGDSLESGECFESWYLVDSGDSVNQVTPVNMVILIFHEGILHPEHIGFFLPVTTDGSCYNKCNIWPQLTVA